MTTPKMSFNQLVELIYRYESDTFSASGVGLSPFEAMNVAEQLILYLRENYLDGNLIKEFLEWHRIDMGAMIYPED